MTSFWIQFTCSETNNILPDPHDRVVQRIFLYFAAVPHIRLRIKKKNKKKIKIFPIFFFSPVRSVLQYHLSYLHNILSLLPCTEDTPLPPNILSKCSVIMLREVLFLISILFSSVVVTGLLDFFFYFSFF